MVPRQFELFAQGLRLLGLGGLADLTSQQLGRQSRRTAFVCTGLGVCKVLAYWIRTMQSERR